ncbi:MAG: hypothetical protein K6B71_00390 [Alphaproteobacteria bacterium]|nr:hypothetical protein [Alphaproteobacteria bacterium]
MPTQKKYLTIGEIAALLNTEYKYPDENKESTEYLYYKIYDQKKHEKITLHLDKTEAFRKLVKEIDVALKAKNSGNAQKFLRDTTIILGYVLGKEIPKNFDLYKDVKLPSGNKSKEMDIWAGLIRQRIMCGHGDLTAFNDIKRINVEKQPLLILEFLSRYDFTFDKYRLPEILSIVNNWNSINYEGYTAWKTEYLLHCIRRIISKLSKHSSVEERPSESAVKIFYEKVESLFYTMIVSEKETEFKLNIANYAKECLTELSDLLLSYKSLGSHERETLREKKIAELEENWGEESLLKKINKGEKIKTKEDEINDLNKKINHKDKLIKKYQQENEKLKSQIEEIEKEANSKKTKFPKVKNLFENIKKKLEKTTK